MSFDCTKWNWGLWNHQHLQVHRSTDTLTDMAAKSICIQCMYFNKMVRRPSKDLHVKVGPWMEGGNKENGWAPSCAILCSLALSEEDPISEIFFLLWSVFCLKEQNMKVPASICNFSNLFPYLVAWFSGCLLFLSHGRQFPEYCRNFRTEFTWATAWKASRTNTTGTPCHDKCKIWKVKFSHAEIRECQNI